MQLPFNQRCPPKSVIISFSDPYQRPASNVILATGPASGSLRAIPVNELGAAC